MVVCRYALHVAVCMFTCCFSFVLRLFRNLSLRPRLFALEAGITFLILLIYYVIVRVCHRPHNCYPDIPS
jgi:hypothetical protein